MDRPRNEEPSRADVEPGELELVKKVARRFLTTDRDDLEAELARRPLALKVRPPSRIRNWESYLAKFPYNKAANWVRDRRAREHRNIPLVEAGEEDWQRFDATWTTGFIPRAPAPELDEQMALAEAWKQLGPELRRLWELLLEERGSQARVARRLGKYRNTVRLWVRKIKQVLKYHGFREGTPF